jgi:hypothetical protein
VGGQGDRNHRRRTAGAGQGAFECVEGDAGGLTHSRCGLTTDQRLFTAKVPSSRRRPGSRHLIPGALTGLFAACPTRSRKIRKQTACISQTKPLPYWWISAAPHDRFKPAYWCRKGKERPALSPSQSGICRNPTTRNMTAVCDI